MKKRQIPLISENYMIVKRLDDEIWNSIKRFYKWKEFNEITEDDTIVDVRRILWLGMLNHPLN